MVLVVYSTSLAVAAPVGWVGRAAVEETTPVSVAAVEEATPVSVAVTGQMVV